MTKVEQFEVVRRALHIDGLSIRETAQVHGVQRRKVREAAESAIAAPRMKWLRAALDTPRQQRHTAKQAYRRLVREHGYGGAESMVRRCVGYRRRELGVGAKATVPQTHLPGAEGEVDFYEAWIDFPWGRTRVYVLEVRACYSGREFRMAFPHQDQQASLGGMAAAFEQFEGAFGLLRFDNLKAAISKVLRGRRREESDRFAAFRPHYLFKAAFCSRRRCAVRARRVRTRRAASRVASASFGAGRVGG